MGWEQVKHWHLPAFSLNQVDKLRGRKVNTGSNYVFYHILVAPMPTHPGGSACGDGVNRARVMKRLAVQVE